LEISSSTTTKEQNLTLTAARSIFFRHVQSCQRRVDAGEKGRGPWRQVLLSGVVPSPSIAIHDNLMMVKSRNIFSFQMSFILIFCVALQLVDAQVFSNSVVDVNFTGLSLPCLNSLNGSITCDDSLPTAIWDPSVYLDNDQLTSLCNSTCSTSLQGYRNSVVSACTSSDIIVIGGLAYPASYRPDEYIFNYNILCRKDA
jgi:hypothetical protein